MLTPSQKTEPQRRFAEVGQTTAPAASVSQETKEAVGNGASRCKDDVPNGEAKLAHASGPALRCEMHVRAPRAENSLLTLCSG